MKSGRLLSLDVESDKGGIVIKPRARILHGHDWGFSSEAFVIPSGAPHDRRSGADDWTLGVDRWTLNPIWPAS
jgi:hypothetical protein